MAGKAARMWFDSEANSLEVMFEKEPRFFRLTESDQVGARGGLRVWGNGC